MSGATTAAYIAVGLSATGLGMGMMGSYNKSKQDKAAYDYQAGVTRNNAQLAEWQAEDALSRGAVNEQSQRMKTAQLKGAQRARMAANGVALDEGSPLDILTTTDYMGERDALTIHDNAAKEAWALREQGKGLNANAGLLDYRSASESPLLSGTSTLLTGSGAVASSWYNYSKGAK